MTKRIAYQMPLPHYENLVEWAHRVNVSLTAAATALICWGATLPVEDEKAFNRNPGYTGPQDKRSVAVRVTPEFVQAAQQLRDQRRHPALTLCFAADVAATFEHPLHSSGAALKYLPKFEPRHQRTFTSRTASLHGLASPEPPTATTDVPPLELTVSARSAARLRALVEAGPMSVSDVVRLLITTHPSMHSSLTPAQVLRGARAAHAAESAGGDAETIMVEGLGDA